MKYEETHPWIQFPSRLPIHSRYSPVWYLMGEVCSKIRHLADSAVSPEVHNELNRFYLIRGVQGSTAIEGNTLTEKEVGQILDNLEPLPLSKRYQEQEIRNVLAASSQIVRDVCEEKPYPLSPEYICGLNKLVLNKLELKDDIEAGVFRTHSVIVGTVYRGAPAEDCPALMEMLCTWLNSPTFEAPEPNFKYAMAVVQAICAHIYLAWIHPFGDGNGRTARLIELYLLLKAGIPVPAAHLLSNHYNKTRTEYYLHLQKLSQRDTAGNYPSFDDFLQYALQGLVDGLREQISKVQQFQLNVIWEHHLFSTFRSYSKREQGKRMRDLLLSLQPNWQTVEMSTLPTKVFHEYYAQKTPRTLQRDLKELVDMQLLEKAANEYRPNKKMIIGMLPIKAH